MASIFDFTSADLADQQMGADMSALARSYPQDDNPAVNGGSVSNSGSGLLDWINGNFQGGPTTGGTTLPGSSQTPPYVASSDANFATWGQSSIDKLLSAALNRDQVAQQNKILLKARGAGYAGPLYVGPNGQPIGAPASNDPLMRMLILGGVVWLVVHVAKEG